MENRPTICSCGIDPVQIDKSVKMEMGCFGHEQRGKREKMVRTMERISVSLDHHLQLPPLELWLLSVTFVKLEVATDYAFDGAIMKIIKTEDG
ncbi:hypothetical protein Tco_0413922 [Tanacetum coccineum]